jgi:prepilin-type N-terminal cleavage/methylation domain-containing protein
MSKRHDKGFTLTELMIAVAILIVVIIATSKIFGTASAVTGVGEATISIMQEAGAIESEVRKDFARLSEDGYFVIRCVAIRNDFNGPVLLNPALPPDATIRIDQLLFFTTGAQSIQSFRLSAGTNHKGQGTASRVYYGHAYQLPEGQQAMAEGNFRRAHDIAPIPFTGFPGYSVPPWYVGQVDTVETLFRTGNGDGTDNFSRTGGSSIDATQPEARRWLLARQAVVLADDDVKGPETNSKTVYLNNNIAARSIFIEDPVIGINSPQPQIRDGRVDAAATQLNDIRNIVTGFGTNNWAQQYAVITDTLYYPRAERLAPSMSRVDQALTSHVIGSGCSSFRVDWTWADGTGSVPGTQYRGAVISSGVEHPWFGIGIDQSDPALRTDGVYPYGTDENAQGLADGWWWLDPFDPISTINPNNIENIYAPTGDASELLVYEAVFGYNQTQPLDGNGVPWDTSNTGIAFTPWPAAVRITMTLHDANTRLPQGREFQFIVNLPQRK